MNLNLEKNRLIQKNSQLKNKLEYYLDDEKNTNKKNNDIIEVWEGTGMS